MRRTVIASLVGIAIASTALASNAMLLPAQAAGGERPTHVCASPNPDEAACGALVVSTLAGTPLASASPTRGFTASQLHHVYSAGDGSATIAVVGAYAHPDAAGDLAAYRAAMGLAPLAPGQFTQIVPAGLAASVGWGREEMLDLEMATAVCPSCRLVYVASVSPSFADLSDAVRTAAQHATVISNSYGAPEFPGEQRYHAWDDAARQGIAVTVSAGDTGYGVMFPAASRLVTAVGGTTLQLDAAGNRVSETAWAGTGSGCSAYIRKPAWQQDSGCSKRTVADVAAVADPATGVAVYDSFGSAAGLNWYMFAGTSVSAPIVAGVYGSMHLDNDGTPVVARAYTGAMRLFDVTSGANGTCAPLYLCTAGVGYDGPSGNGAPLGGTHAS